MTNGLVLDRSELDRLIVVLADAGYTVVGPTVQ